MLLVGVIIAVALVFDFVNGFHDAANSIATVVSTRVLSPRVAIVMATIFNAVGAFSGTAVAATIGTGIVDAHAISLVTVAAAMVAIVVWDVLTSIVLVHVRYRWSIENRLAHSVEFVVGILGAEHLLGELRNGDVPVSRSLKQAVLYRRAYLDSGRAMVRKASELGCLTVRASLSRVLL